MTFELPHDVRRATEADVPAIRRLVNDAYRELAERGWNYTGTYQDDEITRERMRGAEVYLLQRDGELVGSINLSFRPTEPDGAPCLYVNQLAIRPDWKRRGLGSYLLDLAEERAAAAGVTRMRLDTAVPAEHLVRLYRGRGFEPIAEVQWEGKTYRSYVMEKLCPVT